MNESDVDTCFYHNLFDISQSQQRMVRVSKGSKKKFFAIKLFQFCNLKSQQRYIFQEEVKISKRDILRDFLKTFDKVTKCLQVPPPKAKNETGCTKSKGNLFAHYYKKLVEHPYKQILLSIRSGNNNSCAFSIKKFELHGSQFILTEFVNLNHCEIHHLHGNRYYVANNSEIIERNYDV